MAKAVFTELSEFIRKLVLVYWSVFLTANNRVHNSQFKNRKEFVAGNRQTSWVRQGDKPRCHTPEAHLVELHLPRGDSSRRGPMPLLTTHYSLSLKTEALF